MTTFKILNGAPKGSKSLCDTCGYSYIRRGFSESQHLIMCYWLRENADPYIHWPVADCNMYHRRGQVDKEDMEKIGIVLDGTHTRVRGFKADP